MLDELRETFPHLDGLGISVMVALLAEAPTTRARLALSVGEDLGTIDEVLEQVNPCLLVMSDTGAQGVLDLSPSGVVLRDRILGV